MWIMCDSRVGESVASDSRVGLTAVEIANLLAGMHPMDIKGLTRLLTTLRYLERKAEDMFVHMQHMHEHIAYSRPSSSSEEQLRETGAEEVRIAQAEVEELREAQIAYDKLEDDMNDVDGRMMSMPQPDSVNRHMTSR